MPLSIYGIHYKQKDKMMYYSTYYSSPVGRILLVGSDENLTGLWIDGQKYFAASAPPHEITQKNDLPLFDKTRNWLDEYFGGNRPDISKLTLAPRGSGFRQAVWQILCEIPYGEVVTYGYIAKRLAGQLRKKTMSAQAVGGAVGHNPISIIIPCHRVVGSDGSLTGYAGGIDKKIKLLKHEGVDMSSLFVPSKSTAP